MSTPSSIISQLQRDLLLASNATGFMDTTLHDSMSRMNSGLSSANAGINQHSFTCGSFTLSANRTNALAINHNLGVVPSAGFLWSVNAPLTTRGIVGKMRFHAASKLYSGTMVAFNTSLSVISGYSGEYGRIDWTNADMIFSANSTYPLLSGLTYQWLAIA